MPTRSRTTTSLLLPLLFAAGAGCAGSEPIEEAPAAVADPETEVGKAPDSAAEPAAPDASLFVSMATPEGWRTETIPFPLDFAPELAYTGLEELRFAPGMFEPEASDYWSYAFVWWLRSPTELEARRLEQDLEAYFRGLTVAVGESRGFDAEMTRQEARVQPVGERGGTRLFRGEVWTFDGFAAQAPVHLNLRAESRVCSDGQHQLVSFALSPRASDHEVWEGLDAIVASVHCVALR